MLNKGFKFLVLSFFFVIIFASNAFAFESVKFAIKEICGHMQGNLGGLLMTVAGIGGLTAAAFGNMRASHSMIVTGVGAAALSAVLSLYFPKAADECHDAGKLQGDGKPARAFAAADLNFQPQAKTFGEAALTVAAGGDANLDNKIELQAVDEDVEFDPGADEFADGF